MENYNTLIDQLLAKMQNQTQTQQQNNATNTTTEPQIDISGWTPQAVHEYVTTNPGKISQATLDQYAATNKLGAPPTPWEDDLAQGKSITTKNPSDLTQGQSITTSGPTSGTQYTPVEVPNLFNSLMNNQNRGNNSFLNSLANYDPAKSLRESGTVSATRPVTMQNQGETTYGRPTVNSMNKEQSQQVK